jgi:hypothetical protein
MTTVIYPYELAHLVQLVTDDRAECSCGWASAWTGDRLLADEAAVDHREVAVGSPSGLDAALSGLLDLQDDLAAVVMWLAEHWSADLPTPYATPCCRYSDDGDAIPGVRLLVYCCARDELVRVADLLGVPMAADAEPNSHDDRYERSVRRFGRVEVDAYRELHHDNEAVAS